MKQVYEAILAAMADDAAKPRSRRKGYDHWKPAACKALGISKMGRGRWENILESGEKLGYFRREHHEDINKTVLVAVASPAPASSPLIEDEELLSILDEEIKPDPTPPPPKVRKPLSEVFQHPDTRFLPRVGDLLYLKDPNAGVVQGEVVGVTVLVDLVSENGYYTRTSTEVHERKAEAKREDGEKSRAYYADCSALKAERDDLLKEIETLKAKRRELLPSEG